MTIEQHIRTRQIELARSIAPRRKIYLDARFWIIVRDTALGVCTEPAARELLHHLRRGVVGGCLICPISAGIFLELMKQPYSPGRRIGTAQLIDELSLGVSMVAPPIVMGTEIYSFLLKAAGDVDLHPMQELIWTKAAYVLGETYPVLAHLPPDEELIIQKAFCNRLWDCSLGDMVKTIGDNASPRDGFTELSRYTNEKNAHHKDELRSFAHTYDIELRGIIELAGEIAADVIHQLAEKEAGCQLSPTPDERAASVNMCRNLLYHAFKKHETKDALRSLHIGASIHATMRWDKTRKFKPNDYYDFEHATAALSYCDAFLTEGPLHTLVTRPQVNLEAVNDCRVFSDVQAAADHVGQLSSIC
ncbi:hypothetical protein P4G95_02715 [Burkholderia vietnamiensis]|uniref:hypothetical protein n=1 Tax=Burkholderia vietnamiensis TaxID=60552 RepID=UPI00159346AF|nr:hypothetical protein [Burkholderia vietnamiensis]WHU92683.1 hypothetical protein P4G95_02715 [Burkholderia vietnamiensis]